MSQISPPLWRATNDLYRTLEPAAQALLQNATNMGASKGDILFRPNDEVQGFILLLSGHVGVYMNGQGGRDILLYDIKRGQTCIQTMLGMMSGDSHSAEAVCETDCALAILPRPLFDTLLETSPVFRTYVFAAFSERMQNMMQLLEKVAFVRFEARLAAALLERADADSQIKATHQELASNICGGNPVKNRRFRASGVFPLAFDDTDRKCIRALTEILGRRC